MKQNEKHKLSIADNGTTSKDKGSKTLVYFEPKYISKRNLNVQYKAIVEVFLPRLASLHAPIQKIITKYKLFLKQKNVEFKQYP